MTDNSKTVHEIQEVCKMRFDNLEREREEFRQEIKSFWKELRSMREATEAKIDRFGEGTENLGKEVNDLRIELSKELSGLRLDLANARGEACIAVERDRGDLKVNAVKVAGISAIVSFIITSIGTLIVGVLIRKTSSGM